MSRSRQAHAEMPVCSGKGAGRAEDQGSVANFMQEVLKGQQPLSVRGLCGQGGELFGGGKALSNSFFQLSFS